MEITPNSGWNAGAQASSSGEVLSDAASKVTSEDIPGSIRYRYEPFRDLAEIICSREERIERETRERWAGYPEQEIQSQIEHELAMETLERQNNY